uniref:Uncharacterized protein n=1 Tax=Anopheles melas TaxID=34690 RepID=A0A182U7X8_9DIPT
MDHQLEPAQMVVRLHVPLHLHPVVGLLPAQQTFLASDQDRVHRTAAPVLQHVLFQLLQAVRLEVGTHQTAVVGGGVERQPDRRIEVQRVLVLVQLVLVVMMVVLVVVPIDRAQVVETVRLLLGLLVLLLQALQALQLVKAGLERVQIADMFFARHVDAQIARDMSHLKKDFGRPPVSYPTGPLSFDWALPGPPPTPPPPPPTPPTPPPPPPPPPPPSLPDSEESGELAAATAAAAMYWLRELFTTFSFACSVARFRKLWLLLFIMPFRSCMLFRCLSLCMWIDRLPLVVVE